MAAKSERAAIELTIPAGPPASARFDGATSRLAPPETQATFNDPNTERRVVGPSLRADKA